MKNIDLTKILKDCPEDTKLYSRSSSIRLRKQHYLKNTRIDHGYIH